ncbi:MAG: hypothetical protein SFV15_18785 [Polyangiaceae bacterium]|nr:hypothetical protein [Polyangiaceae bacterium]
MATCPQCGAEGEATQSACAVCGTRLQVAREPLPAQPPGQGQFMKTMLGMPSQPPAAGPSTNPPAVATNPGPASPAPAPSASTPAPAPAAAFGRTMLGIAPSAPLPQTTPAGSPPTAPWGTAPAHEAPLDAKRTMLGGMGAPSSFASPPAAAPQPQLPAQSNTQPGGTSAPLPNPALAGGNRTILGVARPGIAPLNPGMAKPLEPQQEYADEPLEPIAGLAPKSAGQKRGLLFLLLGTGLAGTALAAFFLWKSPPKVSVAVALGKNGEEVLQVECPECAEGTEITLGRSRAKFAQHKAELQPEVPLKVGKNDLELGLVSSNGKTTPLQISVPIRYRVTPRLARLSETPPVLEVAVEAANTTSVVVGTKPLTLNSSGVGSFALDITPDVTGQASEVRALERQVPYELSFSDSDAVKSVVTFQLRIIPLRVEAPGDSITIEKETFRLAGQTEPGAEVSVSGRKLEVAPNGTFSQTMRISAAGETTFWVRASREGQAPRLVAVKAKRVSSLAAEAQALDALALKSYTSVVQDLKGQVGKPIAWKGKLVEARQLANAWVLLMDASSGCSSAPCLARVAFGGEGSFAKGDVVNLYGVLEGSVDGPRSGTTIPVVRANFIVR